MGSLCCKSCLVAETPTSPASAPMNQHQAHNQLGEGEGEGAVSTASQPYRLSSLSSLHPHSSIASVSSQQALVALVGDAESASQPSPSVSFVLTAEQQHSAAAEPFNVPTSPIAPQVLIPPLLQLDGFGSMDRLARRVLSSVSRDVSFTDRSSHADDTASNPLSPVMCLQHLERGEDEVGNKVINGYTMITTIGVGSYGKVKLGISNTNEDECVAIKILRRNKRNTGLDDIRREIEIMEKVNHPNLVKLTAVIDDPTVDKMYMVMEYVGGGTLMKNFVLRPPHQPFDAAMFRTRFLDVLHGLQYLHNHNVVHMDIKPENILVGEDGTCKLADFGVSTILQANFERDEDVLESMKGTPMFHAPEVVQGVPFHGKATDVWALGVTMYMCVYGRSPFSGASSSSHRYLR
eukprot:PhM_4_TR13977/c4_g7_i6/m.15613/K07359/CAMKK2; calcium/calmodulin-dependent protein kinase kinase 2